MNNKIELSIVIVNFNSGKYLYETIRSIYDHDPKINFEIIVVDNNSSDNSVEKVKEGFSDVKVLEMKENTGFASANNTGVKSSVGEYILILNNDTEILKNSIETLMSEIKQNPDYGIVSPLLQYGDGSPQLSFGTDPGIISEFFTKYFSKILFRVRLLLSNGHFEKDVDWISGACFLISSHLYNILGGFDEQFFLYYEDADLGKRVRENGYTNHITSKSKIIHFLGKSSGTVFSTLLPVIKEGHLYYYKKHNTKTSFRLIKTYLIIKYSFHLSLSLLTGRKERRRKIRMTLSAIKGVNYD